MGETRNRMEIKFKPENIKVVGINEVKPNSWNPKNKNTEDFQKVKRGIELKGQRMPIVVRTTGSIDAAYEIIDGEQRYTACKELGFKKVLVYDEGKVSDKEAKELTIWYQQQVPFNELELAELIKELSDEFGDGLEVPFSSEEIDQMCQLSEFDWGEFKEHA